MPSRDISLACSIIRKRVVDIMKAYNDAHPFVEIRVIAATRTLEEQQADFAKGRTSPGPVVTNCDGVIKLSHHQIQSMHGENAGHAVDFGVFEKTPAGDGTGRYLGAEPLYDDLWAAVFPTGLTWGGNAWTHFRDRPHVQCLPEGAA